MHPLRFVAVLVGLLVLGAFEDTLHPNELGSAALMRRYERERL